MFAGRQQQAMQVHDDARASDERHEPEIVAEAAKRRSKAPQARDCAGRSDSTYRP